MRPRFRTKTFVGSVLTSAISLLAVALLLSWQVRGREARALERQLITEARLIARTLQGFADSGDTFDTVAHELGRLVESRVTLIAADGQVLGDSTRTPEERAALDNLATRPEVVGARTADVGTAWRYDSTLATDMLYVAITTNHPVVRYVSVAVPLTAVDAQLATIRRMTLIGLGIGIPLAILAAWLTSAPMARQVQAIAASAARYASGDLPRPATAYPADELGTVARVLDATAYELGRKIEDLSRDRARVDAILSGMVEGVVVVDAQGRIQRMNRAATEMLDAERALDQPYVGAIRHPEVVAQLSAALAGDTPAPLELPLPRDPSRTIVSRAAPVPAASGGGAVIVLHDISDIRRVGRMRQDFVANVSHELRTPLTAIRGYAEALLEGPEDAANARRYAEVIARHTGRMERLVADLLRLALLDARQEPLTLAACDVRRVLEDVVADHEDASATKAQRVTIVVPPDAGVVLADAGKLHDIVRNLLENAINHSPDGTHIQLTAARSNDAIAIVVADNGTGIPPQDLDRVFERFYRVDKARARPGGTGLGLGIARNIARAHGGEIVLRNLAAGGLEAVLTLPRNA